MDYPPLSFVVTLLVVLSVTYTFFSTIAAFCRKRPD